VSCLHTMPVVNIGQFYRKSKGQYP